MLGLALVLGGSAALHPAAAGRGVGPPPRHPLLADALWLETDLAWERHDAALTRCLIGLTLAVDPEADYFRLNGARMLAYDLPEWAGREAARETAAVRAHRRKRAAEEALALLARGLPRQPNSIALQLEMGNICLYGLGDAARAAKHYRLVAAQENAPAFASRICRRLSER